MAMFRKKPVVIEARQTPAAVEWGLIQPHSDEWRALADWCGGVAAHDAMGLTIEIETLEGTMLARPGDWIIKGVKGEFYPCRADIFAQTYEAVTP